MRADEVRTEDVEAVRVSGQKLLPRPNGSWVHLARVRNTTRLTYIGEKGTLESEMTPGEGADPLTP